MRHTTQLHPGRRHGFTLVELLIVVGILGILAMIVVPNAMEAHATGLREVCLGNLKKISDAKATWATECNKKLSDIPTETDLFGPDRYLRARPACPGQGVYELETVELKPTCTLGPTLNHSL